MICVYPADCTDFSTNGNGTLAPLSAEVTETLNGEYELTLVHRSPLRIAPFRGDQLRNAGSFRSKRGPTLKGPVLLPWPGTQADQNRQAF